MMLTSSSLTHWQQALLLSHHMLTLAQDQQWEALIDGELAYIQYMDALAASGGSVTDSTDGSAVKAILLQLLDNEAQVKSLLQARMDSLKVLIQQGNQQQSVNMTYGRLAGMLLLPSSHFIASTPVKGDR